MCQRRGEDDYRNKRTATLSRGHQSVIDKESGIGGHLVAHGPTSFR